MATVGQVLIELKAAALNRRDEAVADLQRFLELADSEEWKNTAKQLLDSWRQLNLC